MAVFLAMDPDMEIIMVMVIELVTVTMYSIEVASIRLIA